MEYTKLKSINQYKSKSINPAKTPETVFEMYSVPIYETGHPEYLRGDEIASSKVVVQKNDILLCKINPRINRVWVVSDESDKINIASSEWIVIRNNEYNPEFLAWYFRSRKFQKLMTSEVTGIGGSLTRAQPKRVAEYPVPILDRLKQDEIVDILNRCKFVMDSRKQELSELDTLIKARFVEMFGDPVLNPKNYPEKLLSEIAEYWNGLTYKPENISDEGTIVLRSSNIQQSVLDFEDTVRVNCKIGEKKYVKNNDILMCSRNGSARLVGKVALIKNIKEPMSFGAFMMIIRSSYYPYLMTYFQLPAFRRQITTGATTTINQITGRMLDSIKLPIPDLDAIEKFATFVQQIDKLRVVIQKSLDEAQYLFDSLMQEYFG